MSKVCQPEPTPYICPNCFGYMRTTSRSHPRHQCDDCMWPKKDVGPDKLVRVEFQTGTGRVRLSNEFHEKIEGSRGLDREHAITFIKEEDDLPVGSYYLCYGNQRQERIDKRSETVYTTVVCGAEYPEHPPVKLLTERMEQLFGSAFGRSLHDVDAESKSGAVDPAPVSGA